MNPGYWRRNDTSVNISQCYNSDACKGGYYSTCAVGYGGNLCDSCIKQGDLWYIRSNSNDCAECVDYSLNVLRLVGVSLLIIIYFIVLIYFNIRSYDAEVTNGTAPIRLSSVYMRILTNYFQILTLASSYDLSWTDNMKELMRYLSLISQSQEILFSVDCFLRDNQILIEPVYYKMILACLFPLMCIAVVTVFWLLHWYCKANSRSLTNWIMSIVILIFMTLPAITTITFTIYNCIDVFEDGDAYLAVDMSLQCWTGDHEYYSTHYGIPIILIWIFGLPMLALALMYRNRQ